MKPKIHLAFRFHGSFYHSYRGDTPDELGFGKDMRIIRHLIRTLDELNQHGIPVRGTWDFENYFSLEKIMPSHCPELIADLQRRARQHGDEMQLMSYNNGLINAHTAREFEAAIRWAVSNANGSGLRDLFGERFYAMVRPQEMMFTPIHLKLYHALGIHSISLFYSALPFNAFSNFIPPLNFMERYNPLTLAYPGIEETMTLMPCYNTGDLMDHLTLRRWVQQMRCQQLALNSPQDVLLLIDMDADDEFWVGFDVPFLKGRFSSISGLQGLVENIADLEYIQFTTPGEYLESHPPLRTIVIGQDTADGSFDGLSSWAEKWSNQRLWTGLERARMLDLQARRLCEGELPPPIQALLDEAFETRLKILSTTHFGMAAPVMNLTRERVARDLVQQAFEASLCAFEQAAGAPVAGSFSLLDYARGESTSLIDYPARASRALVRLPLQANAPEKLSIKNAAGQALPSVILGNGAKRALVFVESFQPNQRKDYFFAPGQSDSSSQSTGSVSPTQMHNEHLQLAFDERGHLTSLKFEGHEFSHNRFLNSGISYGRQSRQVESWSLEESLSVGNVGVTRWRGSLALPGGCQAQYEREFLLAAGLPYLYLHTRVVYPLTPNQGYHRGIAQRLEQAWDNRWKETRPCEISPAISGKEPQPLRVWKHNPCNHISSFELDYGRFSKNDELDSVNNQITDAWVAVSNGQRGLLLAQTADVASNLAFCPLRTRRQGQALRVLLNPFGSYWGRQYRYATADTGLGNFLATNLGFSDHIKPYAPSYNGRMLAFSLLIAPYCGDAPPESITADAEAFAYPYLALCDNQFIAPPPHRSWSGEGLGEVPPVFRHSLSR